MYTPKEVAEMLRISYRTVLDLIVLGDLEAHRVGKVYRISEREIHRFIEENKVESFWKNIKRKKRG